MGPWGRYPLMLNYARGAGPRKPGYMATVINLLYEARARANTRAHARTRFLARACALAPSLPHSLSLTLARSTRSLALALSPSLSHSPTHSLPPSLPFSLTHSLPLLLPFSTRPPSPPTNSTPSCLPPASLTPHTHLSPSLQVIYGITSVGAAVKMLREEFELQVGRDKPDRTRQTDKTRTTDRTGKARQTGQ